MPLHRTRGRRDACLALPYSPLADRQHDSKGKYWMLDKDFDVIDNFGAWRLMLFDASFASIIASMNASLEITLWRTALWSSSLPALPSFCWP